MHCFGASLGAGSPLVGPDPPGSPLDPPVDPLLDALHGCLEFGQCTLAPRFLASPSLPALARVALL